jgi:ribosomal protein S18 acetylase RimI-like enzyme
MEFTIETVQPDDRARLLDIALATGLFSDEEAETLLGSTLDGLADGSLTPDHHALVCRDTTHNELVGWTYFAADAFADGVWNVWWIGVHPTYFGTGAAAKILTHIENFVTALGCRVLVIETSDSTSTARARNFYVKSDYIQRGLIPDFYGPGEAKVVFSRTLS